MKDLNQIEVPALSSLELTSDGWIKKYVLHLHDDEGRDFTYEAISRKKPEAYQKELEREMFTPPCADAVAIIGFTENNEVLLIKEYRFPLGQWCTSFPAGLIDAGEKPIDAVERELSEEVGYRIVRKEGKPMIRFVDQASHSSTGMTEEATLAAFALVEPAGKAHPEGHEYIVPFLLPFSKVRSFLKNDSTVIGVRAQFVLEGLACGARFI